MNLALLRLVLLARCVLSLEFAWKLHGAPLTTFPAVLNAFAPYAFLDGIMALALAPLVLAERWGAGVAAVAVLDGVMRVAAAVAIYWWPGIPYYPMTLVAFSLVLAAASVLVGAFQIAMSVQLQRRSGSTVMGLALGVMGGVLIVLSVLSFSTTLSPMAATKLLFSKAVMQGLALAVITMGAQPGRSWPFRQPPHPTRVR